MKPEPVLTINEALDRIGRAARRIGKRFGVKVSAIGGWQSVNLYAVGRSRYCNHVRIAVVHGDSGSRVSTQVYNLSNRCRAAGCAEDAEKLLKTANAVVELMPSFIDAQEAAAEFLAGAAQEED